MHFPKGSRLTLPLFPQHPEAFQKQKTALLLYTGVGSFQL